MCTVEYHRNPIQSNMFYFNESLNRAQDLETCFVCVHFHVYKLYYLLMVDLGYV